MDSKEREEVFKAINDVANRINDVSQKLDEVMHKLNMDSNERITVNNGAISSITEDVLPTMQDDASNLSDMIDNILTDVIPGLVEEFSSTTDTSNNNNEKNE
jgi:hypothetical protein